MKAMVYHGPTDVRYETKPDPEIEHPNASPEAVTGIPALRGEEGGASDRVSIL